MISVVPQNTSRAYLVEFLPEGLGDLTDTQRAMPRIAKDARLTAIIEQALPNIPSSHGLHLGDAREMPVLPQNSVHLVLTSPPYWTLKEYNSSVGQLGAIEVYEQFLVELDKV